MSYERIVLNKPEQWAMDLYNWSIRNNIPYEKCIRLANLSRKAFVAGEMCCNNSKKEQFKDRAYDKLENYARECGLTVEWPGLYPHLHHNGMDLGGIPSY